jgi:hypothetical protein
VSLALYNSADPWSSDIMAYHLMVGAAILFPLINLGLLVDSLRSKNMLNRKRNLFICWVVFAVSLLQPILMLAKIWR